MQHRTIKGKISFITDDIGEMGREWFTVTVHTDGSRTMRALTEMDDDDLVRDITYSVDEKFRPLDCFVRLTINDRFQGSGWFHFTETHAECESVTVDAGRISQRWPLQGRAPLFTCHSVAADAWGNACFDYARKDETQTFFPRLTSSPLGNGGSGPVPAGKFTCDRLILNKGKIPRFETWTSGPDFLPVQLRYDRLNQYYKLVELEM
jgi:hypothetical protein